MSNHLLNSTRPIQDPGNPPPGLYPRSHPRPSPPARGLIDRLVRVLGGHAVVVEEVLEVGEGGPVLGDPVPAALHLLVVRLLTQHRAARRLRHAVTLLYAVQHLVTVHA